MLGCVRWVPHSCRSQYWRWGGEVEWGGKAKSVECVESFHKEATRSVQVRADVIWIDDACARPLGSSI
jgi:hypothetical protein